MVAGNIVISRISANINDSNEFPTANPVGIAIEISSLSCIEAEISNVFSYLLRVTVTIFDFRLTPDIAQCCN